MVDAVNDIAASAGAPAPAAASPEPQAGGSAPAPASASGEPAAAPVTDVTPAPAPAPEPAPAPASETAKPSDVPTLLEGAGDKPAEAKPDGEGDKSAAEPAKSEGEPDKSKPEGDKKPAEAAKPAEGEKPAEAKPAEAPKLEPIAYEYTLPETLKVDDAVRTELHTALDTFRADPSKGAQPLIDLHNKAMTDYAANLERQQHQMFSDTRKSWRDEVLADEQIGGASHQTAMGAIARMRDLAVPEADRASFDQFLRVTGAGDNPAFLRMLHNFARYFDEPALPPPNPKPAPNNGAGQGDRRRIMYDHPRSPGNRQ